MKKNVAHFIFESSIMSFTLVSTKSDSVQAFNFKTEIKKAF